MANVSSSAQERRDGLARLLRTQKRRFLKLFDPVVSRMGGDGSIEARVRTQLRQVPELATTELEVESVNGNVILRGVLPSRELAKRAAAVVAGVRGVKQVDNFIRADS